MTDPLAINPEPAGRFSFQQMIPTLVFDVAMPIVAFNVLTRYGVATLWALVAGGLFPISASGPGRAVSNPSESS